jgi:hypothetical protein
MFTPRLAKSTSSRFFLAVWGGSPAMRQLYVGNYSHHGSNLQSSWRNAKISMACTDFNPACDFSSAISDANKKFADIRPQHFMEFPDPFLLRAQPH